MSYLPPSLPAQEACSEAAILERYRARYRIQDAGFAIFDRLLRIMMRPRRPGKTAERPRRILLANAGHLGDVVISTGLFPVLKDAFPEATLGFLTGSYSRAAIEGHPLLEGTHFLDHWRASRSRSNVIVKALSYYLRAAPAIVRELREANYDVALDLHAWFPNFVPLLWAARIPIRIGFGRLGFGPLLTHIQTYAYDRRHEMEHQLDLLRLWGLPDKSLQLARPVLAPVPEEARRRVSALMGGRTCYRVLHPASSTPTRDWTIEGWATLARNLLARGVTPVITGAGRRDAALAKVISQAAPGTLNAVDQLSWQELLALLAQAEIVYSVETSVGHAAAALGRPVIAVYGGMADPAHWAPLGSRVVSKPQPCSPCFKKQGCSHRSCLLQTTVQDIEDAARLETNAGLPDATA
jgi:ADP-heptose:LPS heptosyltransferase